MEGEEKEGGREAGRRRYAMGIDVFATIRWLNGSNVISTKRKIKRRRNYGHSTFICAE